MTELAGEAEAPEPNAAAAEPVASGPQPAETTPLHAVEPVEPAPPAAATMVVPPPVAEPIEAVPPVAGPVRALEILGRGFDLNVAVARQTRRVGLLIGLQALAALGPYVAFFLALASRLGGFDVLMGEAPIPLGTQPLPSGTVGAINLATLIGVVCVIGLAIDSQLLAVHLIASRATGRSFELRRALELTRMRFWRLLRANVIIAVITFVPRWVLEQWIAPGGVATQAQFVTLTLLGVVLSLPFAYVASWILLGPVGARESIRRSWTLVRSRVSLAVVIAVINVVFQTVALFAIGAGLDVLVRIADALNLDEATGLALFLPVGAIGAVGLVAAGSLIPTIAALSAAPQVVAFLRLTGVTNGLDVLHDPDNPFATPRTEPLVSRGMKIALIVEAIVALVALNEIL